MSSFKFNGQVWKPFFLNITFILLVFILLIVAGVFIRDRQLIESEIKTRARSHVHNILLARSWNAGYGGVYVEKKEGVTGSPFMETDEIKTTDGRIFTKKNPALMAREISDLSLKGGLYSVRITSLKPINPENAPDPFEEEALLRFERGEKEVPGSFEEEDRVYYRYLAPQFVEQSCLSCHGKQGYAVGDIRGGISIRFDITEVRKEISKNTYVIFFLGILISVVLLSVIYFIIRKLMRRVEADQKKIHEMAVTDELTGLFNRRHFFTRLGEEFKRAGRHGTRYCCLMLDIDHFKKVNDTWGHHNGDMVLREIGTILCKGCRDSDLVARLGGEEFIVLLPSTDTEGARKAAEKIRALVESHRFSTGKGERIAVTVSIGVAALPSEKRDFPEDAERIVKMADKALYAAKEGGRNRVEVAGV